jgi:pimeloyl-ACP methyl ester carboxylesterase
MAETSTGATTGTLAVPGATLHYEVCGAGPVLLLICGGIYDAAALAGLAQRLADHYTVVTYDRRGISRSPLDGPPGPQDIAVHADDAHRLLAAVTGAEPAYVFGNSSGGQIGLALATRHPEQVHTLVAHEPPVFGLLPDAAHWRDVLAQVDAAHRTGGVEQAMETFGAAMGMRGGEQEAGGPPPPPEVAEMPDRFARNTAFFVGYEVPGFGRWTPDIAALRSAPPRIVLAAGAESAGEPPHRAAVALAERLGTQPVLFPGDHGGFGPHAEDFATELHGIFSAA